MQQRIPDQFQQDPAVCGGEVCVRGTRIPLRILLAYLAAGKSQREILEAYPSLTEGDVQAVIAYAAATAKRHLPQRKEREPRVFGGAKGVITIHDTFYGPLPPDVLDAFEGRGS